MGVLRLMFSSRVEPAEDGHFGGMKGLCEGGMLASRSYGAYSLGSTLNHLGLKIESPSLGPVKELYTMAAGNAGDETSRDDIDRVSSVCTNDVGVEDSRFIPHT